MPTAIKEVFASLYNDRAIAHRRVWATKTRTKLDVGAWIEDRYNRHRRHSSIGQISPVAFETPYSDQTAADPKAA